MSAPRRLQLLLVALAAGWFASFAFFPGLYAFIGVNHYGVWFLDSFALLASNDAVTRGLDPYIGHALDYFNRPHIYSGWWLHLRDLGLTRADNLYFGGTIVGAFLLAVLWRLRPQSPGELLWFFVVLACPHVVLAVNRANNDLVVFALLAPVVPWLLSSRRVLRYAAIALVALATGLKFYPVLAALLLLACDDSRETRLRLLVALLALAAVAFSVAGDYLRIAPNLPTAHGLMTFGAANLFELLGLTANAAKPASLVLAAVIAAGFYRANIFAGWQIPAADRNTWLGFVLGAVLLTGCFLAGTNYGYRWIFALWLAPLLWRLPRDPNAPVAVRRLAVVAAGLLVFALWASPMLSTVLSHLIRRVPGATLGRIADVFFLAEQPLTWALFACLIGFLVHFVRTTLPPLFAFRGERPPASQ